MRISETQVVRESIRHSPLSNTELNFERLPPANELEGMELRFRVEMRSEWMKRPWRTLAVGFVLAQLYALGWWVAPDIARWLWNQASAVEGMRVVGGMLAGFLVLIVILSLAFVPKAVRVGVLALTLPIVGIVLLHESKDASLPLAFGIVVAVGALLLWRSSFLSFCNSWLSADPRMTTAQSMAWLKRKEHGWVWPELEQSEKAICEYLSYDIPPGIPGTWTAPSASTTRAALVGLLGGSVLTLTHTLVTSAFSILVSGAVLVAVSICVLGEAAWLNREAEKLLGHSDKRLFEQYSERLRNSNHVSRDPVTGAPIREADHLLLGIEPGLGIPILLHQPMLHEHMHTGGRTGSGKTSMALMSLMIQLIKGNRESKAQWSDPNPIVVIDMKGDEVLFQTTKAEAKARGQRFRFFTLEKLRASFCLNVFTCFRSLSVTSPQMVQMLLDAFGLFHGFTYGRGHFSEGSRMMLAEALRNADGVNNFRDLYARLNTLYEERPKEFQDTRELRSTVQSLTYYEQLITTEEDEEGDKTIRFDRVLEDREVVYFWLPTVKESISAARLGRVVLLCLRVAAHDRKLAGEDKRQVYLFIDEFQKLASEQFEKLLQQARSDGIAAILANQSLEDLRGDDHDLMQTVRTNTRIKMHFSVTEPKEIEAFRELSGEELQTYGMGDVEEIRLRLSTKELASLSDHPKRLLLQITSGSGYSQFGGLPIPVETDWPISKQLADERLAMDWPSGPEVPRRTLKPLPLKAKAAEGSAGTSQSTGDAKPAAPSKRSRVKQNADPKNAPKAGNVAPPPSVKKEIADRIKGLIDD